MAELMDILTYVLLAVIIVVCIVAAVLISRRVTGRARSLGITGFAVVALATVLNAVRDILVALTTSELNFDLVALVDMMTALIRTAGIFILALALLAAGRDLKTARDRLRERTGQSTITPQPQTYAAPGQGSAPYWQGPQDLQTYVGPQQYPPQSRG